MGSLKCGAIPLKRGKSSTSSFSSGLLSWYCRNPLEAGQKFNPEAYEKLGQLHPVAIPLKRGKSSTWPMGLRGSGPWGRNPLEAGQKFNAIWAIAWSEASSRNPLEAGQKFNRI